MQIIKQRQHLAVKSDEYVFGVEGRRGWLADHLSMSAYHDDVNQKWSQLSGMWQGNIPEVRQVIAFERMDGCISIVAPSAHFYMMLRHGGTIRHMRQIDAYGPTLAPVFEGTGEILKSMTEREAIEFVAWKDVPIGTNRIVIVDKVDLPLDRRRRNEWQIQEDGRIGVGS